MKRLLLSILGLALLAAACGGGGQATPAPTATAPPVATATPTPTATPTEVPGGVYLALGDSLAYGSGASDREATAYAPLFYTYLQEQLGPTLEFVNLGVSGETTTSYMEGGQEAAALQLLAERNADADPANDVAVITINLGGNDIAELSEADSPCIQEGYFAEACIAAFTEILNQTRANFATILQSLRDAAGPDTLILILGYFNPYSGTGGQFDLPEAAILLDVINGEYTKAAEAVGGVFVPLDAFADRGPELTHVADASPSVHPNDTGYRVMADALIAAFEVATAPPTPTPTPTPIT